MNIVQLANHVGSVSVETIMELLIGTESVNSDTGTRYDAQKILIARALVADGKLEENPWKLGLFRRTADGERLAEHWRSHRPARGLHSEPKRTVTDLVRDVLKLSVEDRQDFQKQWMRAASRRGGTST